MDTWIGLIVIISKSVISSFATDLPVIVTVPTACVVTTPLSSTVAISVLEDDHVTLLSENESGLIIAFTFTVSPTVTVERSALT